MAILRIFLFGGVRVYTPGAAAEIKLTRTVQNLLAYLLLHRRHVHPRNVLAAVLWGDQSEERARSCLNTALWRMRKALEPRGVSKGTFILTTSQGEVGFNWDSDHWLDVAAYEEKVSPVLAQPVTAMENKDADVLQEAIELYTRELLEGFYDDWALRERERVRLLHLRSLAHLMRYKAETGAYEEGLTCGRWILDLDPLREEIHREMMRLYDKSGQRALALRQYESCWRILREELNIPPMEETQKLIEALLHPAGSSPARDNLRTQGHMADGGDRALLDLALEKLRLALQDYEKFHKNLQKSIQFLERVIRFPIPRKTG